MLYAVILFCSLATLPVDCDEVSAFRWERVPGGNSLPFSCFANAEIWAAEHGLAPQKRVLVAVIDKDMIRKILPDEVPPSSA